MRSDNPLLAGNASWWRPADSARPDHDRRRPAVWPMVAILAATSLARSWAGPSPGAISPAASAVTVSAGGASSAANRAFASNCASCHGAAARGGFGPPLLHVPLSWPAFSSIVRRGKGQMPAFGASALSDRDLRSIYRFLTTPLLKPAEPPLSETIAHALTLRRVVGGLFLFLAISILINLVEVRHWMDRAGWKEARKHFARQDWRRFARIGVDALFVEGFGASALYRRDRSGWALHEGLVYVVPVLALVAVLLESYETFRSGLSPAHPLTILSALLALIVLVATITVRRRLSTDERQRSSPYFGVDYAFLELLILAILSGFVSAIAQWRGDILWAAPLHLVQLTLIAILFLVAPSTSFSHAVVVPVLAAVVRLKQAYGMVDDGAPSGRATWAAPESPVLLSETVLSGLDPELRAAVAASVHPSV